MAHLLILSLLLLQSTTSLTEVESVDASPVAVSEAKAPSDLQVADARLQTLFLAGVNDHMAEAVTLYEDIISRLDGDLQAEDYDILNRHLSQLSLIMPPGLRAKLDQVQKRTDNLLFQPGTGTQILTWWRSQDVMPASRANERLQEHLARVAYAQRNFFYNDRVSRLDDRGEVYIRLGEPNVKKEIKFTDAKLVDELFRPGVALSPSDFPSNEVWQYGHVDASTYYIFVKKNRYFQVATTVDLIPPMLRAGYATTTRGTYKSAMLIALLRSIFQQLQPLHPDFAMRYAEVDAYAMRLEEESIDAFVDEEVASRGTGQNAELNVGNSSVDLRRGALRANQFADGATQRPNDFVQSVMFRSQSEDQISEGIRERNTPSQFSEVLRQREKLDVIYRVLRFLEPDNTTRTEIHWSPVAGSLSPTLAQQKAMAQVMSENFNDFIVRLTAVQQYADFTDRVVNQNHYLLQDIRSGREATIPVQQMAIKGDTGRYHLAVQWDQHLVLKDAELAEEASQDKKHLGPQIKIATDRVDSLLALSTDPAFLEMSDIKPVLIQDESVLVDIDNFATLPAYPFSTINREQLFAIYFEIYNLTFGADDLTNYDIDYEIIRKLDGLRLFTSRSQKTSSQANYSGTSRIAPEMLLLDLNDYGGNGDLEIIVTVTDLTSGQQIDRALTFDVL